MKYIQLLMGEKKMIKYGRLHLHAFTEWNPKQRVLVWLLNYKCWFYARIKYSFVLDCHFLSKGWPWKEWPVDKWPKGVAIYMTWSVQFSSVQSNSHVQLFVIPWIAACRVSLSITNSWSLLKLVHRVGDIRQPSHSLSSPSLPVFNFSQHQDLFQGVSSSHQVAKLQPQHQFFQWIFRTDFL